MGFYLFLTKNWFSYSGCIKKNKENEDEAAVGNTDSKNYSIFDLIINKTLDLLILSLKKK